MNGWVPVFVALHIAAWVFIVGLVFDYHFVTPGLYEEAARQGRADALHLASEVGRLDVLSTMIAIFSFAVVVATVLGFWFYRGVVDQRAKHEVGELLPKIVRERLSENPHILVQAIRDNKELLRDAFAGEAKDFTDEIAARIDAGTEANNGEAE